IYLAIAAVLLVVPILLNSNLISVPAEVGIYHLTPVAVMFENAGVLDKTMDAYAVAGAFVLSLFLTIYGIAQYKNRKFQMKLVRVAMVLQLLIIALVFFYSYKMEGLVEAAAPTYNPILGLQVVVIVLCFLAVRAIKKDDELVRSADRLR
nr:DUF4293 domain-containing protein [Flavobacteriales bacterium]